jgi:predicted glycoside hydrolase/deacetylase ChbG (UPF0249 family)
MIVCADDFGLSDDIDEAILELSTARKLSAVSCMVLFERCSTQALERLLSFSSQIDIGLHLCLTKEDPAFSASRNGSPLVFNSFGDCALQTLIRKVKPARILDEIAAQYALFGSKCGRPPDYIDGHLHIHQAPAIRNALIQFLKHLPAENRPYVRNTYLPISTLKQRRLPWLKASIIGKFGKHMAARLRAEEMATNDGFAGVYDFKRWTCFPSYLPRFINCLPANNGILVVHPGKVEKWRRTEFETLRAFGFERPPNRFAKG